MSIPKGAKVFNVVRENSSKVFMETVPAATEDNIQTLSNILFNDAYQPMLNEFVSNLINRIGLTIIRNKSFNNPLALFKKGSVPLGTDIQDIYENPAEAEQYELSNTAMAKLLTITDPDTHVAYYRRNRKDLYTKTITRENLQGAFVSWNDFENYLSAITTSLYSGNYIDEFEYTKSLIDGAYDNNKIIVEQVTAPVDNATSKAFVKKVRALFSKMKLPSTQYNAYSRFSGAKGTIKTWTDEDRIVLIIKADVLAEVEVETLAQAFNLSYADMKARIVEVDQFENEEIQAVICDEAWLQIYDNILRFDEFYNARVMAWNEYLHAWGTFAICPFANAICLATAQPKPATAISVADVSVVEDATASVTVTLTPADATSELEFISGDETVFTVSSAGVVTGVSAGTGTLTVKTDNGLSDTATVTVTSGE